MIKKIEYRVTSQVNGLIVKEVFSSIQGAEKEARLIDRPSTLSATVTYFDGLERSGELFAYNSMNTCFEINSRFLDLVKYYSKKLK